MTTITNAPAQVPHTTAPTSTGEPLIEPREPLARAKPTHWSIPTIGIGIGGVFGGATGLGIGMVMGSVMDSMNGPLGARGTVMASALGIGAIGLFGGAVAGYHWLTSSWNDYERERVDEEVGRSPLDYAGELIDHFDNNRDGAVSLEPFDFSIENGSELRASIRRNEYGGATRRVYDATDLFTPADTRPKDGKLDQRELAQHLATKFDLDRDGVLTATDLAKVDGELRRTGY